MYTQKIMQHFVNPKNVGTIKKSDAVGKFSDEKNGEVVKFYLKIDANSYVIEDASFKTLGSPFAIACSDFVCDLLTNKNIYDAEKIDNVDIINYIGISNVPVEKNFSIETIKQAIQVTIKNYKKKYKIL